MAICHLLQPSVTLSVKWTTMRLLVVIYLLYLHLYCICAFHIPNSVFIRRKLPGNSSFHPEFQSNMLSNSRAFYDPNTATPVDSMNSIDQTLRELGEAGSVLLNYSTLSLLLRATAAGIFVGLGGILTASVGFDMGGSVKPWLAGSGMARFLSGAVGFPVSLLLISLTGCGAWTGDMLLVARAFVRSPERTSLVDVLRCAVLSWTGSFLGTIIAALLATGSGLPACKPCLEIALHRLNLTWLQTFSRAVGGGCFICLALFLSKLNREMSGKVIGIWVPTSTYVICGFEHVIASMFFMSCAKLNNPSAFRVADMLLFLIPSTLGNLVGGALMIGLGLFNIPKKSRGVQNDP